MSQTQKCVRCGASLAAETLKGLCPRCLMALNLATQTDLAGDEAGPNGTQVATPPVPPAPLPEEVAKVFPQLEILECLGRGGMGAVYKARQPKLDRFVALKILLRRSEPSPAGSAFSDRFAREARALPRLNHPAIVGVHEYGEAGGYPFLVMEYVDGLTLRQLLQRGRLTPEEALAIVPKICEALQCAHEQGIVHRDIKPENVLLDRQGRVKIADFGIAKILAPGAQDQSLTGGKDVVGTPHYMAPEQVEKPQQVDHRADIYSLGVVFYEMLTGELPLGRFAPPSKKVQIDVRLDQVVLHALEKEPQRRYQQASEIRTDVETITSTSPPPPSVSRPPQARQGPLERFPRLSRGAGSLIAGVISFLLLWILVSAPALQPLLAAPLRAVHRLSWALWGYKIVPDGPWSTFFVSAYFFAVGPLLFIWITSSKRRWHADLRQLHGRRLFAWVAGVILAFVILIVGLGMVILGQRGTISPPGDDNPTAHTSGGSSLADHIAIGRSPTPVSPDVSGSAVSSPKLRFLAWQDAQAEPPGNRGWQPDGQRVDREEDRRLMDRFGPPRMASASEDRDIAFLYLWFSHPLIDGHSFNQVRLLDVNGQSIPAVDPAGDSCGHSARPPGGNSQDLGWIAYALPAGLAGRTPPSVGVELQYSFGAWQAGPDDVPSRFNGSIVLYPAATINGAGETVEGKAFVSLVRDRTRNAQTQYDFVAFTSDGRQFERQNLFVSGPENQLTERFEFDLPLARVQHFRLRTRPVRTVIFENVSLQPGHRTEVQARPKSGESPVNSHPVLSAGFSPVIEKIMILRQNEAASCLDLDTGTLRSPPGGSSSLAAAGIDLVANVQRNKLQALDLFILRWDAKAWDLPTVEITSRLGGSASPRPPRGTKDLEPGPFTYAFRTREGAIGFLQLEEIPTASHQLKVRYKLAVPVRSEEKAGLIH